MEVAMNELSCNWVITEFKQADKKSSSSLSELDMFSVNSQMIYFNKEKASLLTLLTN